MIRLALAAAVLALAAPAHVAAHAPAHAAPRTAPAHVAPHTAPSHAAPSQAEGKPEAPVVTLTAHIVSGNGQVGNAFAECCHTKYVTEFPVPLVVTMQGAPRKGDPPRVYFHCETPHCDLASTEQPEEGKFVERTDPTTYKAQIIKGKASIKIAVEAEHPTGTYVVTASAHAYHHERIVRATFTLTSR